MEFVLGLWMERLLEQALFWHIKPHLSTFFWISRNFIGRSHDGHNLVRSMISISCRYLMMSSGDPELIKFCISFSILMVNRILNDSYHGTYIFILYLDLISFGYLEIIQIIGRVSDYLWLPWKLQIQIIGRVCDYLWLTLITFYYLNGFFMSFHYPHYLKWEIITYKGNGAV